ncbi:hypothetical protein MTY_0730 [Moorella thermoacetica Y72]|uniref:Uncharacterized protein n=1 Tax=Moorella thermoacetica Y72 TaxID=1325331 RepID=A0A0S6U9J7_NEOTH|nr:hypothetical protein MTY_0730 [Moorella thermoacetica Y72]
MAADIFPKNDNPTFIRQCRPMRPMGLAIVD